VLENTAIITSSKIYLISGYSGSAVYYAPFAGGSDNYLSATGTNLPETPAPDPPPPAVIPPGPNTYVNGTPWKQQSQFNSVQSGDITGWTTGASLAYPVRDAAVVVTNKRVYLLGGDMGGASPTAHTQFAIINDDGTLGAWTQGADLPIGSYLGYSLSGNAVLLGGRVFWMSGTQLVYSAPVNADGSLGTWRNEANMFSSRFSGFTPIVTKNKLFLLASGARSTSILADGTLGTWLADAPPIYGGDFLATINRVYGYCGYSGSASNITVNASINSDGTLGAWATGSTFPIKVYDHKMMITAKTAYSLGGAQVSSVYYAPVNSDGTIGTWVSGTPLPGAVSSFGLFVTSSRIFVVGGRTSLDNAVTTVYSAPFQGGFNSYMGKTFTTP
jgi:hypothetical protein